MEFLEKYIDKPWYWDSISYNNNLTMEIINKYPTKP